MYDAGHNDLRLAYLTDITQSQTGADLASARVGLKQRLKLSLARDEAQMGEDVWTFGYPLTDAIRRDDGVLQFQLNGRYLQGYIMRAFYYDHHAFGRVPSYEIDLPTPAGLSGAPIVRVRTRQVLGVVYGSNDVASIEEIAQVDPKTGERRPEIHRIVSFGLAHHTRALYELSGAATEGKSLRDYLGL